MVRQRRDTVSQESSQQASSSLRKIHPDELQEILQKHKIWFESRGKEGERAELSKADLHQKDLSFQNLAGANLRDADFSQASMRGINFKKATLAGTNFSKAGATFADFSGADLRGAKMHGANLSFSNFNDTNLRFADFLLAYMRGTQLEQACLAYANFTGAAMLGVNFHGADFDNVNLARTILWESSFRDVQNLDAIRDLKAAQIYGLAHTPRDFKNWAVLERDALDDKPPRNWKDLPPILREHIPEIWWSTVRAEIMDS